MCSLLNRQRRAQKGGRRVYVCMCARQMSTATQAHWPSSALLFLRANPAASPPLPPQPPQELYNCELLSLCYLTHTLHTQQPPCRLQKTQRRDAKEA